MIAAADRIQSTTLRPMPMLERMIAALTFPVGARPLRRMSERAVMPRMRPTTPRMTPRIGISAAGIERMPRISAAVARPLAGVAVAAAGAVVAAALGRSAGRLVVVVSGLSVAD